MAAAERPPDAEREASRLHVTASKRWYDILGVQMKASLDDVKKSFRKLALLHHPDKGGDTDTFKRVQLAYEEGSRKCRLRPLAKPIKPKDKSTPKAERKSGQGRGRGRGRGRGGGKDSGRGGPKKGASAEAAAEPEPVAPKTSAPAATTPAAAQDAEISPSKAQPKAAPKAEAEPAAGGRGRGKKRARPKLLPANASNTKIKSAVDWWGSSKGQSQKTMPDEIPMVSVKDVAMWLREGTCLPVDARDTQERSEDSMVPSAVGLSYMDVLVAPEVAALQVAKLRSDNRRLVFFSEKAERMGQCGMVGALLLDIFGLDEARVCRLQGGCIAWRAWLHQASSEQEGEAETDKPLALEMLSLLKVHHAKETLSAAKAAEQEAVRRMSAARQELTVCETADQALSVLASGDCGSEEEARTNLDVLLPQLQNIEPPAEPSLRLMLEKAAFKPAAKRGAFDTMTFEELGKRFAQRLDLLRGAFAPIAEEAEQKAAASRDAQAAADQAMGATPCPGINSSACTGEGARAEQSDDLAPSES